MAPAAWPAPGSRARSAWLTSPTFGGISWLAHSTFQSGLWVDSQPRYDAVVTSGRQTLSDAFRKAGWRTVGDVPSNTADWPTGRTFYHYDKVYDSRNVGYAGPAFSYARMPDQYTLDRFRRDELTPHHAPVFAELDLVSSHTPWTPLPHLVPWRSVGNGTVFDPMPAQGRTPAQVAGHPGQVRALYGQSIRYTLSALVSWVQRYGDDRTVLVVLGDHQPATLVSGENANHVVPISIVAHDPKVLARISGWRWQPGLRPGAGAALADGRVPRQVPLRLRPETGDPRHVVTVPLPSAGVAGRAPALIAQVPATAAVPDVPDAPPRRLAGLDGVRGVAALFVVVNHLFLRAFPRLPSGHRTVLGGLVDLRPVRRRRVHRPVRLLAGRVAGPPRLAAGRVSPLRPPPGLADPAAVLGGARLQPGRSPGSSARPGGGSPRLALGDWSTACWCRTWSTRPSPNRAYWTIAIEVQLYVVFPLLLLMIRRWRWIVLVGRGHAGRGDGGDHRPARLPPRVSR